MDSAKIPPPAPLLPPTRGTTWYCLAVFCLAFFAALSCAGFPPALPNSRLTVQIMPDSAASHADELPAAIAVLKATPGIASTAVMSDSENLELVAPWLGGNLAPGTLPFPVLIDVKLAPGKSPDMAALQKRLLATAPHAVLDDGRQSALGATGAERRNWLAMLLLAVCCLSFAIGFALHTRARIAANREMLQLLHLLGATKSRITRLLALPPAIGVLVASAAGTLVASGLFLLPASGVWQGLEIAELPVVELPWLALIPVTTAIIAWLTGWFLVTSELRRL